MRTFVALIVSSVGVASVVAGVACSRSGEPTAGTGPVTDGVVAAATAAEMRGQDEERKEIRLNADSSPYIVGEWKFVPGAHGGTPAVDTEFRFVNPTDLDLTLEYAFFEEDGTFCGCDRDEFPHNKTTVYTIFQETMTTPSLSPPNPSFPFVFVCKGNAGALKSIVFKNKQQKIFLDDALQVGFQARAFGNIMEPSSGPPVVPFLTGAVMTESDMEGISLNDATRDEIRDIHQQCVTVNGPL